jgi:hypothetical protein
MLSGSTFTASRADLNPQLSDTYWLPGWQPFHTNVLVFSSQADFHLTLCLLTTNWVTPIIFKITPRHRPHRNIPISIVVVQLLQLPSNGLHNTVSNSNSVVLEACLPHCCTAMALVSLFVLRFLPSKGSICHNIKFCSKNAEDIQHIYTRQIKKAWKITNIIKVQYFMFIAESRSTLWHLPSLMNEEKSYFSHLCSTMSKHSFSIFWT